MIHVAPEAGTTAFTKAAKRIQVRPKARLSLQKQHCRAEHWIVVTGTAEITTDD